MNGDPRRVPEGASILDLLASVGLDARAVAVEFEGAILKRDRFGDARLSGGETVEIVRFVQGG